jgi:hypothetical protein
MVTSTANVAQARAGPQRARAADAGSRSLQVVIVTGSVGVR